MSIEIELPSAEANWAAIQTDVAALDAKQSYERLVRALDFTASYWLEAGALIAHLESLGESLDDIRRVTNSALLGFLRRIGCGQVSPELVARFPGQQSLMMKLSRLPIPDQKRIARGGRLPVMVTNGAGGWTAMQKTIEEIVQAKQLPQVIDGDQLRSETGQISYLQGMLHAAMRPVASKSGKFAFDPERGEVEYLGNRRDKFPLAEMERALKAFKSNTRKQPVAAAS